MTDIIILIACILCGFISGKYIERQIKIKGKFYEDLRRYISVLKENLSGRQLELDSLNKAYSENCSEVFADYLMKKKLNCKLNMEQTKNLGGFFDNLVCISSEQLLNHLTYYEKIICTDIEYVREKELSKATLYSKIGALLGAMVGILFM